MTNNNPQNTGVVDPSTNNDLGLPDFLDRASEETVQQPQPVFDTQVDAQGQTELTVENLPSVSEGAVADGTVTSEGNPSNEALVTNVPGHEQVDTQPEAAPEHGRNAPADPEEMRKDFFKDINKFGKASGEGASALGRLGFRALRAAADGIISTAKPTNGGKDDATLIYEAYTAMDSKHSEHTAGGAKANVSKLRQIIGMGCMTTLSDPVAIGDRVQRIHQKMTDAELKPKAIFAALVDVAREQQGSDSELTDAAIEQCLTKTKADKTLEKEWEAINKRIEGLITGEASHGLKDTSDQAHAIAKMVADHVKNYKLDGKRQELIDQLCEEHGYTVVQATAIVDKTIKLRYLDR